MSDRTTLEIIAPTVEEALSQGLSQLGLTADAVSVEVLDSGSKGLFGLGGRQGRVPYGRSGFAGKTRFLPVRSCGIRKAPAEGRGRERLDPFPMRFFQ